MLPVIAETFLQHIVHSSVMVNINESMSNVTREGRGGMLAFSRIGKQKLDNWMIIDGLWPKYTRNRKGQCDNFERRKHNTNTKKSWTRRYEIELLGAMVIDIGDPFFFILIVIEYWSSNLFNQIKNILCSAKEMVHHFILVHHGTPFYLFSDLLSRGKAVLSNFRVWMKRWCEKFRSHSQRRNPSQNRDLSKGWLTARWGGNTNFLDFGLSFISHKFVLLQCELNCYPNSCQTFYTFFKLSEFRVIFCISEICYCFNVR